MSPLTLTPVALVRVRNADSFCGRDLEFPVDAASTGALVDLIANFTKSMHGTAPHSRISFDSDALAAPCSGKPPSNTSIDQTDMKALSEAVDFMIVMDCECMTLFICSPANA